MFGLLLIWTFSVQSPSCVFSVRMSYSFLHLFCSSLFCFYLWNASLVRTWSCLPSTDAKIFQLMFLTLSISLCQLDPLLVFHRARSTWTDTICLHLFGVLIKISVQMCVNKWNWMLRKLHRPLFVKSLPCLKKAAVILWHYWLSFYTWLLSLHCQCTEHIGGTWNTAL